MATRTTKTTTPTPTKKNPTTVTYNSKGEKYVTNTNSAGTKTAVSVTNEGIKTVKVVNSKGEEFIKVYDKSGNEIKATNNAKPVPDRNTKTTVVTPKVKALTLQEMNSIPFKNNAITKFQGTPGKSYIITAPEGRRSPGYGTIEQADSAYAEKFKWNNPYRNAEGELFGKATKQGYQTRPSEFSNYTKAQIAALPDYVAPKNTNKGPLKRVSDVPRSTGQGTCEPGYVLRNGRCVPR